MSFDYDVLVIGSGFGGSVTALRLTEKGYRVGVLEAGQRFDETNRPKTSWDSKNYNWAPALGRYGMQRIHVLPDVVVLAGAGVGGGSLVYANTLYEPQSPKFFQDPQWAHITDWKDELAPYYDQARRMLGVVENPLVTPADELLKEIADEMGVGDTFRSTPVGVFFGPEGTGPGTEVEDPFFGGAGPRRTTCTACGACTISCRFGAKNQLDLNYIYLAEQGGAQVYAMTTVLGVKPASGGGYEVLVEPTDNRGKRHRRTLTAEQVVFAAGTYNTQKLLHSLRDAGDLPNISTRLGVLTRTNSESILGVTDKKRRPSVDHSTGIAITSSFHPDEHTHIEPNHFGKGNNSMSLMQTVLTDGGKPYPRSFTWLKEMLKHPLYNFGFGWVRRWSERSIVLLVMQTLDNSITVSTKRRLLGGRKLTTGPGHGEPNPTWIPVANTVARRLAQKMGGRPGGTMGEIVNAPMTAHFIGGCTIGDSPQSGVVDPYHRLYGHDGLHVVDGSTISANLGVNPALTITAQAERAMAFWPNRGERDERPPLGAAYERLAPVQPVRPTVHETAPGALRLPIVEVRHAESAR